jgi:hypothetical protein
MVLAAEELARREVMQTRARCLSLRDKLRGQLAVIDGATPSAIPSPPAAEALEDMRAWEEALVAANQQAALRVDAARDRQRAALAAAALAPDSPIRLSLGLGQPAADAARPAGGTQQAPTAGLPAADAAPAALATGLPAADVNETARTEASADAGLAPIARVPPADSALLAFRDEPAPDATHSAATDLAARLERALRAAGEIEDDRAFDVLAEQARRLAAAGPHPGSDAELLVFEASVADQLKAARQARTVKIEAEHAVLRIAHIDAPAAEALRQLAANATSTAEVETIRREAHALLEEDRRKADADYATQCLEQVLTEMGYTMGAPLDPAQAAATTPDTRHMVHAQRPDLPGHLLRLQVSDQGKLFSRVVALRPDSPQNHLAAEEATCVDVLQLPSALATHGVSAKLDFQRQPGEVAMAHSADAVARHTANSRAASTRRAPDKRGARRAASDNEAQGLG